MRILVFTTDVIPLAGLPTSGTALRTFGLIQGLRSHGHEVIVSVPRSAIQGLKKSADPKSFDAETRAIYEELRRTAFDSSNQNKLISEISPDAIICGHWPAMTLTTKPSQALIIDLAGPHMLERHYQEAPNQEGAILAKLTCLGNADHFIVSGPKQRLYFLSYLLRAGIRNPEQRIVEITMPLEPEQPSRLPSNPELFPHFVFGGVFLPWQNPVFGLRTLSERLKKEDKGKLSLIGGKHPNYKLKEGVYTKVFKELSENPRVETKPMLPYAEFIENLRGFDVAIDLMSWNLERELAVTIRSTTYLWAGVPIIYNDYADLASLITEYDAGWCIPPDDEARLNETLTAIYQNPEMVAEKSRNALRLAKERFSWDKAVEPLLNYLVAPEFKRLRETDIIYDFPDSAEMPASKRKPIEQYFQCRVNGLSRVECRMATHNRTIDSALKVELFRVDAEYSDSGKLIYSGPKNLVHEEQIDGAALKNNEWLAFDFDPQSDSAGKTYVFRMEGESASADGSVSPWAVKGTPYPLLGLFYDGDEVPHASLCFRTTCAGDTISSTH